ncbi:glycosyltransferase [Rhabdochromatium marinum]|uniref:glycosyltransferase n=1 Tax=Rhabdochromatium marinum TaxID=48729 RepID=UPI001903E9B5|nr:glycosyltransferase [Rhabdochromatium marinum]MBK1648040.1 hypothetical protein [Rhabdochromatium marinum]
MNIALIHHRFPGQFVYLARKVSGNSKYQLIAITSQNHSNQGASRSQESQRHLNVTDPMILPPPTGGGKGHNLCLLYQSHCPTAHQSSDPAIARYAAEVHNGREVARRLQALKQRGLIPDIAVAHLGWGEALYVKDVFPDCPLLGYCEYYYQAQGADFGFDREFSTRNGPEDEWRVRSQNASLLLSLSAMDYGISPTPWQRSLFPPEYQGKIEVLHEGVDTDRIVPCPSASFELPDGRILHKDQEIVTYSTRNLEPYRGFHQFLRAAAELCRRRPDCLILIAGGDGVSYSPRLPRGQTYRERLLRDVEIDQNRVLFLGTLPFARYVQLLQVSAVHVYLTVPFVLSWSLLDAMAAEAIVIASNTAPVRDLIVDGYNGLLVDFFSPRKIADRIGTVLDHPERFIPLGRAARQHVIEHYQARTSVARYERIMQDLVQSRRIARPEYSDFSMTSHG